MLAERLRAQREREAALRREVERLEAERADAERREAARREAERLEAERQRQREAERRRLAESSAGRLFRADYTSDGFVALRSGPATSERLLASVPGGTRLRCEASTNGDGWRYCPGAGGWVYARLLIPITDDSAYTARYRVIHTDDGFVAVRSQPSARRGERIAKLHAGHRVHCDRAASGQRLWAGDRWLHCPDAGGWIYAGLLEVD
jgi:hypothetical protein